MKANSQKQRCLVLRCLQSYTVKELKSSKPRIKIRLDYKELN